MTIQRNTIIRILEWLIGVVFLISVCSKVFEVDKFAELISRYGFSSLSFLAPLIVVVEATCALLLLLHAYPRLASVASLVLLVCFTGAFIYANVHEGMTDCGCFGSLVERTPAWLTYVRNAALMAAATLLLLWLPRDLSAPTTIKWILIGVVLILVAYESGHTYRAAARHGRTHPLYRQPIKNTALNPYVNTSADSTYFVYIFSYGCTTCVDGLNNIKEYDHFDTRSRLCLLSVSHDKDSVVHRAFNLPPCETYVGLDLQGIVTNIPALLYIEHDTVKYVIEGVIPSVYSFRKYYMND